MKLFYSIWVFCATLLCNRLHKSVVYRILYNPIDDAPPQTRRDSHGRRLDHNMLETASYMNPPHTDNPSFAAGGFFLYIIKTPSISPCKGKHFLHYVRFSVNLKFVLTILLSLFQLGRSSGQNPLSLRTRISSGS